jgi:hypothetical protein
MSERTAVDPAALAGAGRAASVRSRDVLEVSGAAGAPLARLAADLAGAACATGVTDLRQAAAGVLGEVGGALDRLGRLLAAASGDYAAAEDGAVRSMPPSPAAEPSAPAAEPG